MTYIISVIMAHHFSLPEWPFCPLPIWQNCHNLRPCNDLWNYTRPKTQHYIVEGRIKVLTTKPRATTDDARTKHDNVDRVRVRGLHQRSRNQDRGKGLRESSGRWPEWIRLLARHKVVLLGLDKQQRIWYNRDMTNTIITTAMLTILLLPVIMIGVADAKRHPWGK